MICGNLQKSTKKSFVDSCEFHKEILCGIVQDPADITFVRICKFPTYEIFVVPKGTPALTSSEGNLLCSGGRRNCQHDRSRIFSGFVPVGGSLLERLGV